MAASREEGTSTPRIHRHVALVAWAATLAFGPAVSAQTVRATQAPAVDEAEDAAYQRGVQAFRDRRYAEAIVAFEAALRRNATPERRFAYGQACRAVGRYVDAVAAFEGFIAAPPVGVAPTLVAEVREQVAQLRRSLAELVVEVTPASATLRVDGRDRPLQQGAQPFDPGAHVFELAAPGFVSERRELTVAQGSQLVLRVDLRAVAQPRPRLLVEPSVAIARVSIDGHSEGVGRVEREVTPGDHLVEIAAEGHEPFRRAVTTGTTGLTRIDASLQPRARGVPGWVLPAAIAGGVALVAGAVVLGVVLSADDASTPGGNVWDNVPAP